MDELTRLTQLARIRLKEEEAGLIAPQLERIIEYFQRLKELELSGVEPTIHGFTPGIGLQGRADEPIPWDEELGEGFPYLRHRYFTVPWALAGP
jgi:aspartyl-tRNA(Asn)/glutamyl-tRNA(Gln) amidotransferase subunit C